MRARYQSLLVMAALLCAGSILASEEGAFTLRKFRFESFDESGPVVVSGTQKDTGIDTLRIDAFRKSFTLTPVQLKQLRGLIVNGVQLSGEGGYKELGGRTLYLILSMGFTSGVANAKLVSVNERGDVKIENVQRH
jgi:hypothetical protein